jgi:alkylation response protein AidB-like acyl-CoA dehydrogenase
MKSIDDFTRPRESMTPLDRHLRRILRRWADEEVIPHRRCYDEDWKTHRLIEPALKKLMVDLGLQRALFPAELGGWGLGSSDRIFHIGYAMAEEVGRADTGLAVAFLVTFWPLSTILVEPHVNWKLARELAPRFCQGDEPALAALCMTEPQGGSDIENLGLLGGRTIRTTARLEGDEWVINGHKLWPTNTGGAADLLAVICSTNPGSDDPKEMALIFVPADLPGVTQGDPYEKAGMAADKNGDVWLEDVRVPSWYRAHGPGDDAEVFAEAIPFGLIGSMGFAVGAMMNLHQRLTEFVSTRTYAGVPLKENDAIAGVIGRIAGDIDICRILGVEAARICDGRHLTGERLGSERTLGRIRNLKEFVSDRALSAFSTAMDVLGLYGADRDWDIEKHWRDVKMIQLWMGGKQLCQMEAARWFFDCETL